jgi:hypothetical protein
MARGWESKGVESQIEALEQKKAMAAAASASPSGRDTVRDSLLLSRTRVVADLAAAHHPRHRFVLVRALAHLDEKLKELDRAAG